VVRSPTLPANGPDPLPACERSGGATCPGGGSPQPKQLGAPDLAGSTRPPPGPESPYTTRHPTWAGPEPTRVRRCGHARGAAWLPLEDSPTYRIQCGRRKCALPQQSPRRLLPGCTVGLVYQGAQCSRWHRPRHICQSTMPVGRDGSASPIMTPTRQPRQTTPQATLPQRAPRRWCKQRLPSVKESTGQ